LPDSFVSKNHVDSRTSFKWVRRKGCLNLPSAFSLICLTRSLVKPSTLPMRANVRGSCPSKPKCNSKTCASRASKVFNTRSISRRSEWAIRSASGGPGIHRTTRSMEKDRRYLVLRRESKHPGSAKVYLQSSRQKRPAPGQ